MISGAEHVAPMEGPPLEGEHFIVRAVNDNASAKVLKGDEADCGPNKRRQFQNNEQEQHGVERP